jgi:hypothetical protein
LQSILDHLHPDIVATSDQLLAADAKIYAHLHDSASHRICTNGWLSYDAKWAQWQDAKEWQQTFHHDHTCRTQDKCRPEDEQHIIQHMLCLFLHLRENGNIQSRLRDRRTPTFELRRAAARIAGKIMSGDVGDVLMDEDENVLENEDENANENEDENANENEDENVDEEEYVAKDAD